MFDEPWSGSGVAVGKMCSSRVGPIIITLGIFSFSNTSKQSVAIV